MTPAPRADDLVVRQGGWGSFEDWRAQATTIKRVANHFQWAVARWVLWGESRYGERYAQAVSETGLAPQTVLNILSVYRAFPDSRQRENLSFAHHAAVAALPADAQDAWLDQAEHEGMSVTRLRAAVQESRRSAVHGPTPPIKMPADAVLDVCCRDLAEHAWRVKASVLPHCPTCTCAPVP